MNGLPSRRKGSRIERELVALHPGLHTDPLAALAARWREDAEQLQRRYEDERVARIFERHAGELEQAIRERDEQLLSLHEAARDSGLSYDHLRHQVAAGVIPNAGRPHAPRIRRCDLPGRPQQAAGRYDPEQDAVSLLAGTIPRSRKPA